MRDSIDGVMVAVNRHVCLSFGMALNKYPNSGANESVRRRSASSRTCESCYDIPPDVVAENSQGISPLTNSNLH